MSIVAFKNGVLAADSLATAEDGRRGGYVDKIGALEDGSLWAFVGASWYAEGFAQWAKNVDSPTPPSFDHKEATGVLITADGRVREWWGDGWDEIRAPFHAWGCGAALAIGAMAHGASAELAVAIACEWDTACGGEIQVLELGAGPSALNAAADEPEFAEVEEPQAKDVAGLTAATMSHLNV